MHRPQATAQRRARRDDRPLVAHRHRRPCRSRQIDAGRPPAARDRQPAGRQARERSKRSASGAACLSNGRSCSTRCRPNATRASPSTPARSASAPDARDIVLIDAPGHAEFLRNMITGASQADAALADRSMRWKACATRPGGTAICCIFSASAGRGRRQQDGPGRLRPGKIRRDQSRDHRRSFPPWLFRRSDHPDFGARHGDGVAKHTPASGLV